MAPPIRVRFAPSPTGHLHIGGVRTALFNWLFARHHGGTFVLRIEDTDRQRNSTEAVEVILNGLRWLGMDWDEGPSSPTSNDPSLGNHGPYFQSQRDGLYAVRIQQLKDSGHAYERDGALYFCMNREPITIPDVVVGDVVRPLTDREQADPDWVLVRSDGTPVFHLVNVVDDLDMGITHVIRGEDHLVNTAKHIALFLALGAPPPVYAHIPLILNEDGSKMSKRDRGAEVIHYMTEGFNPEAVLNYLALLGWSSPDGREILALKDLIQLFDLGRVHRSAARFDIRKLEALHFEHTRVMDLGHFVRQAIPHLQEAGVPFEQHSPDYVSAALDTAREKGRLFKELPAQVDFFFIPCTELSMEPAAKEKALTPAAAPHLEALMEAFKGVPDFTPENLEATLKQVATVRGVKAGVLVQPCRVACTGKLVGPSLYHLLAVLGSERVVLRLQRAIQLAAADHGVSM